MLSKWNYLVLSFMLLLVAGCTGSIVNYSSCFPIDLKAKTAVIPFSNNTETPLAGERAMSIAAAVLESRGICNLDVYQNRRQGKVLFPGMNQIESQQALLAWARSKDARYALTGAVNEWTYKVGLDGEPVVGLSMQLIELSTGKVVWTGVASRSGGSRIAVTTVAQETINSMFNGLFSSKCTYVRQQPPL